MSKSRDSLFSVADEIAVHPELPHEAAAHEEPPVASEKQAEGVERYYSSVAFEPGQEARLSTVPWDDGTQRHSFFSVLATTALCGIVGACVAIPILFLKGNESWLWIWMACVFGPFAEETLKQSGMVYLLEKRPAAIQYDWQFALAAFLAGSTFGILENLLYQYVYLAKLPAEELTAAMNYRWTICTALHIGCTLISSLGLRRAWRRARANKTLCQISDAFPWFITAMAVHGTYNLLAIVFDWIVIRGK